MFERQLQPNNYETAGDSPSSVVELPTVLTPKELAFILRCGRSKAYELLRTGQIRTVRIGRNLRIPRSALPAFLGGREEGHEA